MINKEPGVAPVGKVDVSDENNLDQKRQDMTELLKDIAAKTAVLDEHNKRTEAYLNSEQGQKEMEGEREYDDFSDELDQKVLDGELTKEEADQQLQQKLDDFDEMATSVREDYLSSQTLGSVLNNKPDDEPDDEPDDGPDDELEDEPEDESDDDEPIDDETGEDERTDEDIKNEISDIDLEIHEINEELGIDDEDDESDSSDEEIKNKLYEIDRELAKIELAELSDKLNELVPELAELYARNRRLFRFAKDKARFEEVKKEYEKTLDKYTKLKAKEVFESGEHANKAWLSEKVEEMRGEIDTRLMEFIGGDLDSTIRTEEEIEVEHRRLVEEVYKPHLREEYYAKQDELKTKVSAEFLQNYLDQQRRLEDETIDKLDNGTWRRKFVSKVMKNKYLKGALTTAAVAGLAVTGVGLAAGLASGAMTIGLSYTAGGVIGGAAKGAITGGLMSRQDSKNSAVRGFATEEDIKEKISEINILTLDSEPRNVAAWLMDQYESAKDSDLSSNRKRTLVSVGLGATLGALMSGVQIGTKPSSHTEYKEVQTGNKPVEVNPTKIGDVNVAKGHGAYDTFTQMGGDPKDMQKALDIMYKIDAKYGLSPGSNGEVAGFNGAVGKFAHTYPGPINTWPDVAQKYIREVASEWAKQGLVPGQMTGGEPIYDVVTEEVANYIPNAFTNFLSRATAHFPAIKDTATYIASGFIGQSVGNKPRSEEKPEETAPVAPAPGETPTATATTETVGTTAGSGTTGEAEDRTPERGISDDIKEFIIEKASLFGGEDGAKIVTSESRISEDKMQSYWNGLNIYSKSFLYQLISSMGGDPEWGRSFRNWIKSKSEEELGLGPTEAA